MTLILGGLVVWRLSHMVVKEMGPLGIFAKYRADRAKNQQRSGGLFDMVSCVACTSVYIGAVASLAVATGVLEWIMYTLAFSAIATLIERFYGNKPAARLPEKFIVS